MLTREQAVKFLSETPVKYAHLLGFKKLTDLHNGWMRDMLTASKDKTLQAHRGSYKTTCVSVILAVIMILLPNKRTMFMRKTDTDVKEIISQVANILKSPVTRYLIMCIYGIDLKLTTESATELSTNLSKDLRGTHQLVGMGIGGSLTGKHFDFVFTDDIVNVKDRVSKAERDKTKIIYQELQNIKNRGGRVYNTGTPWHKDDCFKIMPPADVYDCYTTGLIDADELASIKSKMTPSLFAANYEMRHIASDDVIFTDPEIGADLAEVEQGLAHVDAAYGGEDNTAFTVMNKKNGKYYVLGKLWHKHVDDCLDIVSNYYESLMLSKAYCEDNGDKGYLAKEMRKKYGIKTIQYHENMNKALKIQTYLKSIWQDIIFVEGTDKSYIEQICDYTENAEHDDAPDSCACLARLLSKRTASSSDYQSIFGL